MLGHMADLSRKDKNPGDETAHERFQAVWTCTRYEASLRRH